MKKYWEKFWAWYDRHFYLNLAVTTILFLFQLTHLYWLFTDIILLRLTGHSYFHISRTIGYLIVAVDYIEIPVMVSAIILYISLLRKQFSWKNLWLLVFLNIHWLHLFWITDDIVVQTLNQQKGLFHWTGIIAWFAILIDYLEIPIMIDTVRMLYQETKKILAKN